MSPRLAPTDTEPHLAQRGRPRAARRRGRVSLLLALLGSGWAFAAAAQEDPQALAARALFDEGRQLMSAGQLDAACRKLEESQALRSGIGTQFNLASCYEKSGRVASAWSMYRRVVAETRSLGQVEREEVARQRAAALEPRVSRLTLQVGTPVPSLSVRLDDAEMTSATWGVATPIDPGEHSIVAEAPGHRAWRGSARIPDQAEQVTVEVPALLPLEQPAAAGVRQQPQPAAQPDDSGSASTPLIIGATGAAGVLVSGLLGLNFLKKNESAREICSAPGQQTRCPDGDIAQRNALLEDARKARSAGFAMLGLGLVGVGVSGVWLLSLDDDESAKGDVALRPRLDGEQLGLSVSGRF